MGRIEKTVFICYRRANAPWALAVYQYLTRQGYDVFFDYRSINSGDFEQIILGNLKARVHFLVLLTPSALERCAEPGDWLRREIETALETRRNIVPLMLEGFDFNTPSIARLLAGSLASLKSYDALSVPVDYFEEAMGRLCNSFLNVPLEAVLHPLSGPARQAALDQQVDASRAKPVQRQELSAQVWFEKGYKQGEAGDNDEAIRCYSAAIRLQPDYVLAYNNRGNARKAQGDLEGALRDYDAAIRLQPDDAVVYYNRGLLNRTNNNLRAALADYQKYLDLGGGVRDGNQAEVEQIIRDLKRKL